MMLELTEASSVPFSQNTTVQIETRGSVMPQLYARDLAITAVICFIGGVGLTLLVVLVCYQVFRRKKLKKVKRQKEDEGSSTVVNHNVSHLDVSEKRKDVLLQTSSSKPWDREAVMLDTRLENHGGQFRSRVDENSSHFKCPDCGTKGQRGIGLNAMRWNNRINGEMETEEDREKRRMRMVTEEERRKPGTQQGILGRDIPNKLLSVGNSNSSHPWRETFSETLSAYETGRDVDGYRINVKGKSTGYETLHCKSCHRIYRPPEPGRIDTNTRDTALFNGFPPQHRLIDEGRNHNQFDIMKNAELRRELRNVTFDLESLRTLEQGNIQGKDKREQEVRTSTHKEKGREKRHKATIQSSRLLKVKLNLNPLRKSKVHPKRRNEQDRSEKSSSKKRNEKRQHGKERREKEGKGKPGKKTKESTKSKGTSDDCVEEKEEDDGGEGRRKTTSKHTKTTSESEQDGQNGMACDQGENTRPDNSQSGDTTNADDQSASAIATDQAQNSQGESESTQYQGAGLVLGNAELPSKHPFSLSAAERNHTATFSLLGSAGSQLTGSNLSLQGGNFLLNTMAPGFNALLPSGPANSVAPSIAITGPNLASSGTLGSFSRQTGVGLLPPATSLLANTVHANLLQASAIHTTPLHNSQAGGLALNLAANPAVYPEPIQSLSQSQLPPDSSPVVTTLKSDLAQGPGLQTGEVLYQLPPESQAPQRKESLPVQAQVPPNTESLFGVTSQTLGSMTTVENPSNNSQTETGRVPGGSAVNMLALAEGPAAGVSADSMQAADVSVSGVSGSSADDAPVLLHQEYVSEEGDSSPRRKLRLALPEKTSSRPPSALERKIR